MWGPLAVGLLLAAAAAGQAPSSAADDLCFNELQVLGSHNSYHVAPEPQLAEAFGGLQGGPLGTWEYSLPPLTQQLAAGVRAFELDVQYDPQGGLYAQAAGLRIAGYNGWLTDPKYQQPGFKVLHVPDFDFGTSCILLADCLAEIRAWSDANPGHLPIQLHLEVKQGRQVQGAIGEALTALLLQTLNASSAPGPSNLVQVPEAGPQLFADLQAELAAAFGGSVAQGGSLLTPDDVRAAVGAAEDADLPQLLLTAPGTRPCRWPSLASMRGKVLVKLIQYGGDPLAALLQQAHPNLRGSLAWVEQNGRQPLGQAVFRSAGISRLQDGTTSLTLALPSDAAGMVERMATSVRDALQQGFVVRARADAETVEARANYTARRDAILAAGAQVVATDYLYLPPALQYESLQRNASGGDPAAAAPPPPFATSYAARLPGGLAGRCLLGFGGGGDGTAEAGGEAAAQDGVYCRPLDAPQADDSPAPSPAAAEASPGSPAAAPQSAQQESRTSGAQAAAAPALLLAAAVVGVAAAAAGIL